MDKLLLAQTAMLRKLFFVVAEYSPFVTGVSQVSRSKLLLNKGILNFQPILTSLGVKNVILGIRIARKSGNKIVN